MKHVLFKVLSKMKTLPVTMASKALHSIHRDGEIAHSFSFASSPLGAYLPRPHPSQTTQEPFAPFLDPSAPSIRPLVPPSSSESPFARGFLVLEQSPEALLPEIHSLSPQS